MHFLETVFNIIWMTLVVLISVGFVSLFLHGFASTGPYCPGKDPSWLGPCQSAPNP